eukprot:gb/GECG01013035.1/.p1 GENE.gb/GECG01013035.1/~~gb/GECG01013035.1/.p1  ORF type:complete len:109 (+),score=8.04 gb/GECG01013035.1/:1-327(+)
MVPACVVHVYICMYVQLFGGHSSTTHCQCVSLLEELPPRKSKKKRSSGWRFSLSISLSFCATNRLVDNLLLYSHFRKSSAEEVKVKEFGLASTCSLQVQSLEWTLYSE